MSDERRLVALVIAVIAFGIAAFGLVRGLSDPGLGEGTRWIVAVDKPVDAASLALARHVLIERLDARVVTAGEQLVVETTDNASAPLIERTGKLELRDGNAVVLDGPAITHAGVFDRGVALEAADASRVKASVPLSVTFDGKAVSTVTADRIVGNEIHLHVGDDKRAAELVEMIDAGAAHPMHVVRSEPFTRATGFVARTWVFFAIAAALFAIAGVLLRPSRL